MPEITPVQTSVVERFLRYVTVDTQSSENSTTYPSTLKQLVLLDQIVEELRAIGLKDVTRDEHGYVFATIPATTKKHVPVIGFIAHVDTSPEAPGANVKAIVHRNWQGQDLVLPDDPTAVLRASENPEMLELKGHDLITASGKTLLGADDKAGCAELVAAAEYLVQHPEIPHGAVRLGFTPDEEVGAGTKYFDVKRFGAVCAYTMDGESRGQMDIETFSADAMTITFQGFNTHPGFAKGRMINAIKIAADFVSRLPKGRLSPESTEEREGYVHPYVVDASVERTSVKLLIRDFTTPGLKEKEDLLAALAQRDREGVAGRLGGGQGGRVVPQHEGDPRPRAAHRRVRARGHPPRGTRGARVRDPRRHRRLAALVHGAADAERVRRRPQLPLAARVGVGAGHGQGGRSDREHRPHLGGEGVNSSRPCPPESPVGARGTAGT